MLPIAFGHRQRVGKDSASKFLVSYIKTCGFEKELKRGIFARELKYQCHLMFGWDGLEDLDYYDRPENEHKRDIPLPNVGKTPRDIWIEYGMKMREIYEDIWVDLTFHNADCDVLVISDLRFPNEVRRVRDYGGMVIRIDRPSVPISTDKADNALRGFDDWDYVITNDKDLKEFFRSVQRFAEEKVIPLL